MPKRKVKHTREDKPSPSRDLSSPGYRLVQVLVALAAVIAIYLLTISWSGRSAAGCGPESPCHKVLNSRWAYWIGVPVSLLALLTYGGVLMATFSVTANASPSRRKAAKSFLTVLAVTIVGSALWFLGLQVFVLRSVCLYCLAAHGLGLVAAAMVLFKTSEAPTGKEILSPDRRAESSGWRFASLGLVGVALLIAGQVLHKPRL